MIIANNRAYLCSMQLKNASYHFSKAFANRFYTMTTSMIYNLRNKPSGNFFAELSKRLRSNLTKNHN